MNSVSRKLALGFAVAIAAAACGDKVTVPPAVTPVPTVRSVLVSPSSATIAQGASFQFGAAVDADVGLARTVTWTTAGGSGVTVDATGLATASATATGVASVCAASTASGFTDVKSCAQLTISPAAPPATVQIDAVTVGCTALVAANPSNTGACGLQVPVSPSNVFGQIDVQTVINRPAGTTGANTVKLEVFDAANLTTAQFTQTETLTADETVTGLAAQQAQSNRVTFSVQTAFYDLSGAGGTAKVFMPNGAKVLKVSLVGSAATAVAQTNLFFRNANGFHIGVTTNLATGNNANGLAVRQTSGNGFSWNGGTSLAITAIPVSYTGATVAAVLGTSVGFGSACDLSGTGARNLGAGAAAPAATITGGILSGTLPYVAGAASSAASVSGYQMNPACGLAVAGEVPFAVGVDATGNPFLNIILGGGFPNNTLNGLNTINPALSSAPAIRLDNGGPNAIAGYTVNPNGRNFGWFNAAVQLNVRTTATTPNGIVAGALPTDPGIGGTVTLQARGGVCTTVATCSALPTRTDVTGLAESATGSTYNLVVQDLDSFGNFTTFGAVDPFGVDITAPTIAATLGTVGNSIVANVNGAARTYSADDATATVGAIPSGIVGPNNITVSNQRRDAASSQFWCPANVQFQPSAGACASWATGTTNFVQAAGALSADPGANAPGGAANANNDAYYGVSVTATDNAGNTTAAPTVTNLIKDATAPSSFGANFLPSVIPTTGGVTFGGSTTDNLDAARAGFAVNYPGITAGGATLARFPWATTGSGAPVGGLTPTGFNFAGPSVQSFAFTSAVTVARSVEQAAAGNTIAPAVINTTVATNGFNYLTMDVARNSAPLIVTPIGIGATGLTGASAAFWSNAQAATPGFPAAMTWRVCGGVIAGTPCAAVTGNVDIDGAAVGAANTASRVLQAVVGSTTNPFQTQFLGGVTFYVVDVFNPLGTVLVPACTAGSPVNDQATNTWIYSCTYTPSTLRASFDLFGFNETTGLVNAGVVAPFAVPVIAIGMNTSGAGLATQPVSYNHQQ